MEVKLAHHGGCRGCSNFGTLRASPCVSYLCLAKHPGSTQIELPAPSLILRLMRDSRYKALSIRPLLSKYTVESNRNIFLPWQPPAKALHLNPSYYSNNQKAIRQNRGSKVHQGSLRMTSWMQPLAQDVCPWQTGATEGTRVHTPLFYTLSLCPWPRHGRITTLGV